MGQGYYSDPKPNMGNETLILHVPIGNVIARWSMKQFAPRESICASVKNGVEDLGLNTRQSPWVKATRVTQNKSWGMRPSSFMFHLGMPLQNGA